MARGPRDTGVEDALRRVSGRPNIKTLKTLKSVRKVGLGALQARRKRKLMFSAMEERKWAREMQAQLQALAAELREMSRSARATISEYDSAEKAAVKAIERADAALNQEPR